MDVPWFLLLLWLVAIVIMALHLVARDRVSRASRNPVLVKWATHRLSLTQQVGALALDHEALRLRGWFGRAVDLRLDEIDKVEVRTVFARHAAWPGRHVCVTTKDGRAQGFLVREAERWAGEMERLRTAAVPSGA